MRAITVDDELPMLSALTRAVKKSPDITSVVQFSSCTSALRHVEENPVDVAFLDISMRGMGGLALAEKILQIKPACKIVFCTGYSEYALDAIQLRVSGYLLKPITEEAVQKEINHIKGVRSSEKLLTVKCFGNFEVYHSENILKFKRSKSKELLAYLIDRNGSSVTAKQICAVIWAERVDDEKNANYLYQLFDDLKHTLNEVGAGSVLLRTGNTYAVDVEKVHCDYYDYLKMGKPEFYGEYMFQYSWAEETCALLNNK